MSYFQIAIIPVPTAQKEAYLRVSTGMAPFFKEFGALQVFEGWGAFVPPGEVTSLPMAVQLGPDETVVTSFIEWPDMASAEACMTAMETDERIAALGDMPFDGKRMIFGTFETLLKA
ncbi:MULTISPECIES: DUF1428 domain-containing protein [Roseobacteraceae]|uniref:DUF1428 domain-containing protein n=2 Tax=Celeribacter baekdonensis TaxID=875171 RepID=K2JFU3_9RHOB|nr:MULTISPECIES: DUF1428 domain-containing protein [Roseobacteraceae]EKE73457.1 hypothetical protein B30_05322 [Celeribacter baekdonensis B30]KAB6717527.1 DUF1428 domain-containing protein [Roseobacter sp. TSBP12]SDF05431.1 Uncharacterized conserved protein YbaA, DUF1428 family [Celeribacter baekdonensis]|tara:strand:+ start:49572 stop:49922 length:351 start_codon:yes stop_codon:yes gene_type:complete